MKLLLLKSQSGDWEGLFLDGQLFTENHKIGDEQWWFRLGKMYHMHELVVKELVIEDDIKLADFGNFPANLSELVGKYLD